MLSECQCLTCKHLVMGETTITCKAFDKPIQQEWTPMMCAIPYDIISGKFDHTNPYPGDNGILYEFTDCLSISK